jgi:DNA-binding transcriptional MerR regulator
MTPGTVNDFFYCHSATGRDTVQLVTSHGLIDLAQAAGVSPRTVRYYQATGLLQKPGRAGRQAVYDDAHLERLNKISGLRSRGLKLDGIREMLQAGANGQQPAVALLGSEALSERWLAEATRTFDARELAEFLGDAYPSLLDDLIEAGYLQRLDGPGEPRWRTTEAPLLRGALQLAELGTEVALSGRSRTILRRRLRRLSEDLIRLWLAEAGAQYEGEATTEELELNIDRIRAVAWQSAAYIMAEEIERAVQRADELAARESA